MGKRGVKPETSRVLPVKQLRPANTGKSLNRKRVLRRVGLQFRLGLHAFVASLFRTNETLPVHLKMTDYEIVRQIRKEFAENEKILKRIDYKDPRIQTTISTYRMNYNLGALTSEGPPSYAEVSLPYDDRGRAVSVRSIVPKVISKEKEHEIRVKYAIRRNEWLAERGLDTEQIPTEPKGE